MEQILFRGIIDVVIITGVKKFSKNKRDVQQEREGTSLNYFTISNNFLGLSCSISDYLGLSQSILVHLGATRCISMHLSESRSI